MPLAPVRRFSLRFLLRALVRPRVLAFCVAGCVLGIALGLAAVRFLGGEAWVPLLAVVVAPTLIATQIDAADARAWRAGRITLREPRVVDEAAVPRPTAREVRRRIRARTMELAVLVVFFPALVVAVLVVAGDDDLPEQDVPSRPVLLLEVVLAVAITVGEGNAVRRGRRLLQSVERSVSGGCALPRATVRVSGFAGYAGRDVAVESAADSAEERAAVPANGPFDELLEWPEHRLVVVSGVGRPLRDLVLGDTLVCDGDLRPGGVVRLAGPAGAVWSRAIRAPAGDESSLLDLPGLPGRPEHPIR